jgi:hypothetical protein
MSMPRFTAEAAVRGGGRGLYAGGSRAARSGAIVPARPCCEAGCDWFPGGVCNTDPESFACHQCLAVCNPHC